MQKFVHLGISTEIGVPSIGNLTKEACDLLKLLRDDVLGQFNALIRNDSHAIERTSIRIVTDVIDMVKDPNQSGPYAIIMVGDCSEVSCETGPPLGPKRSVVLPWLQGFRAIDPEVFPRAGFPSVGTDYSFPVLSIRRN